MVDQIVECIPNFSEARKPEVVESIVEAITSEPGVVLLDRHSDEDHNRTVLTFVGSPSSVEEAAFRGIQKAAALIDMNQHSGEHPRLGATDVVPLVPISGVTMQECVDMAHRLGQRVGEELGIPVYFYEEAATRPDRKNLEDIRRGEYEGLKKEMGADPDRVPDCGPTEVGSAGATVIGAREPLIAFNVFLTTNDLAIAKKIARAVRHSSGGFRYVKALGMLVDDIAQVSMNLTNYRKTPVATVVEFIRREAERYGVGIRYCELVGLIPQGALVDAAQWYLQLDLFKSEQILEQRIFSALQEVAERKASDDRIASAFMDEVAAGTPTPGGGSAAAHTAALAAALVAMVARLTVGKEKYASVEQQMRECINRAEQLRASLIEAVKQDAVAFEAVMEAYRYPQATTEQKEVRAKAIEQALKQAAEVPLQVGQQTVEVMELALATVSQGNVNAITDAGTAANLAEAVLESVELNVRVNVDSMKSEKDAEMFEFELRRLKSRAEKLMAQIRSVLVERGGLSFS
ncbi:MAG: glutamate formimidoyltransferase [Chloroflexota bacterium]